MERDIFVTCYLDESFNDFTIKNILKQAVNLNIKMYKYIMVESLFEAPPIDIETALQRIKTREDEAPVLCRFEDTSFSLFFIELDNGNCKISLGGTNYPWKKEFANGKEVVDFDLPRYIRFMLQLVRGLKFQKVKAYTYWR